MINCIKVSSHVPNKGHLSGAGCACLMMCTSVLLSAVLHSGGTAPAWAHGDWRALGKVHLPESRGHHTGEDNGYGTLRTHHCLPARSGPLPCHAAQRLWPRPVTYAPSPQHQLVCNPAQQCAKRPMGRPSEDLRDLVGRFRRLPSEDRRLPGGDGNLSAGLGDGRSAYLGADHQEG